MSKERNDSNTLQIVTLVGVVLTLALGLAGNFAGVSKEDVTEIVKAEIAGNDNAAAPAAQPAQPAQPAAAPAAVTKIEVAELEDFYADSYVQGDKNAKVTIIEFSDFECPFCKRHDNAGTVEQVMEKYGDDVNVVFSHFPLSFHPLAQKAQEAAECVGEQGGDEAFYAFKKALFAQPSPTREAIKTVVAGINGVDAAEVETCIDAGTFAQKVTDMMNFGRKLGVTGTPGNIVMNNETGEFTKVSGAVPVDMFTAPVDQYLN